MNTTYKITVIVPAYNADKYLRECLDSIVKQTIFQEIEVVVINDGSTDSTLQIAKEYEDRYLNFKVYSQENKGLSASRGKGIELASGEYIGWVDADDFIRTNMYEKLLKAGNGADVITCNYSFYPHKVSTKEKWFKEYKGKVDWDFIERNTQPWNKIVKKNLLLAVNMPYWITNNTDGVYALCLLKATKIVTINEELYVYRVGHTSMSSDFSNLKKFEDNVIMTERQIDAVRANGLLDTWGEYYNYRVIYSILQLLIVASINKNSKVYEQGRKKLNSLNWKKNKYVKIILDTNHGKMKSFVLRKVIPLNYRVAKIICNKFF